MYFNTPSCYIGNCRIYLSKSFSYFRYRNSYFPDRFHNFPDRSHWFSVKKEDRTLQIWVLSSSQYKYTTFFAQIQILLTFRNTLTTVKMRRFAAARVGAMLYYETGKNVSWQRRYRWKQKIANGGWQFSTCNTVFTEKNNSLPWLVKKTLYFCIYIEREKSARPLDGHRTHIA